MIAQHDHYAVLGITRDATTAEIKLAYRKQALAAHPDVGGSTEHMVALNSARDVLLNAREAYDRMLATASPAPHRSAPQRARPVSESPHHIVNLNMVAGRMPWGKHRGELFEDVPSDYLRWVLREADAADVDLRHEIRNELDRRRTEGGVEYVCRGAVIHISINGDLPLCGSLYVWKSRDTRTTYFPYGGRPCEKGCFR
ncbi:MAG: putative quorum-sensing-regulated virulence factor [Candidatus Limnocylindrales bacterium]